MAKVTPWQPSPVTTKNARYLGKVYLKDEWYTGAWYLAPYLQVLELTERSIHADTTCSFQFDFGVIKREDTTAALHVFPYDLVGKFVCIRVVQDPPPPPPLLTEYVLWVGIIVTEGIGVTGIQFDGSPPFPEPAGTQIFHARGLEYLLDKRRLVTVPVVDAGQFGDPDPNFQLVNVIPTFNLRRASGRAFAGNRSLDTLAPPGPSTVPHTFGFSLDGAVWNHADVIEFALTWSDDWTSNNEPHFVLGGDTALLAYLESVVPEGITADDRSILSLIRMLVDQRRGLDAAIRFRVNNRGFPWNDVELHVYSTTDVDVSQGGRTLPRNPNQVDVEIAGDLDEHTTIDMDKAQLYDEIVVQGEPMVVCLTAAGIDAASAVGMETDYGDSWARLVPAWPTARLTAFKAANKASRALPIYERVLRRFKLADKDGNSFDWKAFKQTALYSHFHPNVNADGSHTMDTVPGANITQANSAFGNIAIKILRELPLTHIMETEQEMLDVLFDKPMAFCRQMKDFGTSPAGPTDEEVWFPAHEIPEGDYDDVEGVDRPFRPKVSARVTVSDRDMEIDIHFVQGVQALGHGDLTEAETPDDPIPAFDWRQMVVTVALVTDYRPSITIAGIGAGGGQKKLVLRVPDAHYWIAPAGAVVHGVTTAGKLLIYNGPWAPRTAALPADFPTEGILRNDMPRLVDVALLASVWYGRDRSALTVTKTGILDVYPLGTWIRSITVDLNRNNVGTVVTTRSFDFRRQRTTIKSGLFNIDPRL